MSALEGEFSAMEQQVQDAGIDAAIAELREELKTQDEAIANYNEEIIRLNIDVDNVRRINDALPTGCVEAESAVEQQR